MNAPGGMGGMRLGSWGPAEFGWVAGPRLRSWGPAEFGWAARGSGTGGAGGPRSLDGWHAALEQAARAFDACAGQLLTLMDCPQVGSQHVLILAKSYD